MRTDRNHKWNQDHEWLRLYRAAKELSAAIDRGEVSLFGGPPCWALTDLSRALERIVLTDAEAKEVAHVA